jgi:hypothetical protein
MLGSLVGLDCSEPEGECPGDCITAMRDDPSVSDQQLCDAMLSLTSTSNPDPALSACLAQCDLGNPCVSCATTNCGTQLSACNNDTTCTAYLNCALACNDPTCVATCASSNPGTATTALNTCITGSCQAECVDGSGGAGGGGGAGGAGGSGGN